MTGAYAPPVWVEDALCAQVGPESFFPEVGDAATAKTAKAICAACPVLEKCREYATSDETLTGIWGGMTQRDRALARRGTKPARTAAHGTHGGYGAHRKRGEVACPECREAERIYSAARRRPARTKKKEAAA